jgi:hypothetical protein
MLQQCWHSRASVLRRARGRAKSDPLWPVLMYGGLTMSRLFTAPRDAFMSEISQLEAFSSYRARPTNRARSALSDKGALVVSCWYSRFQRAERDVLRYEEDLSAEEGTSANTLRTHLAQALAEEVDVRLVVAVAAAAAPEEESLIKTTPVRTPRTTFYARKDLTGRVTFFDGQRFVIEFRKAAADQE